MLELRGAKLQIRGEIFPKVAGGLVLKSLGELL